MSLPATLLDDLLGVFVNSLQNNSGYDFSLAIFRYCALTNLISNLDSGDIANANWRAVTRIKNDVVNVGNIFDQAQTANHVRIVLRRAPPALCSRAAVAARPHSATVQTRNQNGDPVKELTTVGAAPSELVSRNAVYGVRRCRTREGRPPPSMFWEM